MLTHDQIKSNMPEANTVAAKEMGKRIRQSRRARNVTARQLAASLDVRVGSLYHWEQGVITPSPENLRKTSLFVGLPIEYFLDMPFSFDQKTATKSDDILGALESMARLFGDGGSDWRTWSSDALSYFAAAIKFAHEPLPEHLADVLSRHPISTATDSVVTRWYKRKTLVNWFFSANEDELDTVENIIRISRF